MDLSKGRRPYGAVRDSKGILCREDGYGWADGQGTDEELSGYILEGITAGLSYEGLKSIAIQQINAYNTSETNWNNLKNKLFPMPFL